MLTTFALVALLSLQDPPVAQEPPAAEAAAPAVPAAPTETSESVRAYLVEAESHLYDPQAAGLSSLEFDMPIELPAPVGAVGSAHVTWTSESGADISLTQNEGGAPGVPPAMVDGYGRQMSMQLLGYMLNKPITSMLEGGVAAMDGVEDGLVKVRFHIPMALEQGVQEQALYFDDAGMLQRMRTIAQVEGPMGQMKVEQSQSFAWKPASEGSELMVADQQTTVADMGIMKVTASTSFGYTTVSDIVLTTSASTTSDVPMQGKVTQVIAATNLRVNGQPAGG